MFGKKDNSGGGSGRDRRREGEKEERKETRKELKGIRSLNQLYHFLV